MLLLGERRHIGYPSALATGCQDPNGSWAAACMARGERYAAWEVAFDRAAVIAGCRPVNCQTAALSDGQIITLERY